jgi:hypothetical protein
MGERFMVNGQCRKWLMVDGSWGMARWFMVDGSWEIGHDGNAEQIVGD